MMEQIKHIWQPGAGGLTVGQEKTKTRVSIVTFDTDAQVVAELGDFTSNDDLINALSSINQTTAQTVDGSK